MGITLRFDPTKLLSRSLIGQGRDKVDFEDRFSEVF